MDEHAERRRAGFKERTRLPAARERLRAAVDPHGRTETVPLASADGRVLAAPVSAGRDVPHYERAAMDGFAVRAGDTFGAGDRSPVPLRIGEGEIGPDEAVRVHTGSAVPPGGDAVVMVEGTEVRGDEVEVFEAVAEGENVAPVGEDVGAGEHLYDADHRLRPSDLGLLKSVGVESVPVAGRATVAVVPTGEELVQADPGPGEVIETNGLTVSRLARRWGADPSYRKVVTDDPDALRSAIERDLDHDVVVTTGGSSVGQRDLLPEVVDGLGEMVVHGVALKPGHPVGFGVVEGTPVIALPGYPVACIVNAVQFLRPAVAWAMGTEPAPHPTTRATLGRKIASEPGVLTFARVRLTKGDADGPPVAEPTRASGSGVLSSVALADGWVVVPEGSEGVPAGETVAVEDWEWSA